MAKLIPGWFPELTPDLQWLENELRNIVKNSYRKYWYINIETPSVEKNEILTSKWWDEISKQIFGLYWLSQGAYDSKDYSLHFDLTVPLARYTVEHENELKFPFKRFAMQKVFRWERQQKWRFKEFMQCDVDVIDEDLDLNYDIETIETLYNTIQYMFSYLKINKDIEVHLNNKKFIKSICNLYKIEWKKETELYSILDDYYKRTNDEFLNWVFKKDKDWQKVKVKKWLIDVVWNKYEEFLSLLNSDIEAWQFNDENIKKSFNELQEVYKKLKKSWVNVIFDPYITRWLDYYTWTVFETFISNYTEFWSVCSGGRYENLVWDIRNVTWIKWKKYSWVWGSIWLTRLFSRLIDEGLINKKTALVDVIIFNIEWVSCDFKNRVIDILRKWWINTDVYYKKDKLWKQFSYAENKNIPYGIFVWENEEIDNKVILKNLDNRDSFEINLGDLLKEIREKLNLTIN